MVDIFKEKCIITSPEPVTFEATKNIIDQMTNSVCRIYNKGEGTGFFTKIPFKSKLLPVLITNNHIINKNDIEDNQIITLYLNNDKITKTIKLDNNKLKYTNEELDITIIELKNDNLNNKFIELDENIINYFKLNKKENPNYLNKIYSNKSIYILNYPENKNIVVSYGQPSNINDSKIYHYCQQKKVHLVHLFY